MLVALILYKKSDTLKVSHKLNVAFSQRDWFLSFGKNAISTFAFPRD